MNQTEAAYKDYLERQGTCARVLYEPFPLVLGQRIVYWFDFLSVSKDGNLIVHEVKAGRVSKAGNVVAIWQDDARVKWKIACERYAHVFQFVLAIRVPAKSVPTHGAWIITC